MLPTLAGLSKAWSSSEQGVIITIWCTYRLKFCKLVGESRACWIGAFACPRAVCTAPQSWSMISPGSSATSLESSASIGELQGESSRGPGSRRRVAGRIEQGQGRGRRVELQGESSRARAGVPGRRVEYFLWSGRSC